MESLLLNPLKFQLLEVPLQQALEGFAVPYSAFLFARYKANNPAAPMRKQPAAPATDPSIRQMMAAANRRTVIAR